MAARTGWVSWGPTLFLVFGLVVWSTSAAEPTHQAADPDSTAIVHSRGDTCEELVRSALRAEAAGKSAEREKLLRQALERDPNYAPARWHLGYVRVGREWLKWDEAQRRAASDPRVAEYRTLFDRQAGTPVGELALARWCRDKGLEDFARFHWSRVLGFQAQNEEALKALGVRWYQGQLLTHDQIVASRQGLAESSGQSAEKRAHKKDWAKYFAPRVTKWQRMIQEGNAGVDSAIREELSKIKQSSAPEYWAAVQAVDSILLLRSQWKKDEAAYRALSLKWIKILDSLADQSATVILARHAVDHPLPEVRTAAADALKRRPKETYVPILLARMRSPVQTSFTVQPSFGSVRWGYTFYQEGPRGDLSVTRVGTVGVASQGPGLDSVTYPWGKDAARDQRVRDNRATVGGASDRQAAALTAQALGQATVTARQVQRSTETTNAAIEQQNGRVRATLSQATGTDCGESPAAWWDWWEEREYARYDLEKPAYDDNEKPQYEYFSADATYVPITAAPLSAAPSPMESIGASSTTPSPVRVRVIVNHLCCFPRGTVVWSLTGPVAIDKVKVGDRVLSQNPVTAELAYKPVLETTVRKLRPMMRISVGSEVIAATRGHPFLVAGEGWKVAKDLKVGMRLCSVPGPVVVDGLEDVPRLKPFYERLSEKPDANAADDLAYNLIVDESHTYFVGNHRVLVFDGMFHMFPALAQAAPGPAK